MSVSCSDSLAGCLCLIVIQGSQLSEVTMMPLLQHFPVCAKSEGQNMQNYASALEGVCMEVMDTYYSAHKSLGARLITHP